MISDKYKCIFVHIPRTAGHSISDILNYDIKKRKLTRHAFPDEYQKRYRDNWNKYFKFTCIRNPFDRLVSAWIRCSKLYSDNWLIIRGEHRKDDELFDTQIKPEFHKFIKFNLEQYISRSHFRFQKRWFENANYDYVCRYEKLEQDMKHVCNQIPSLNFIPMIKRSITRKRDYNLYYDNSQIIDMVKTVYKEDIDLWEKYS